MSTDLAQLELDAARGRLEQAGYSVRPPLDIDESARMKGASIALDAELLGSMIERGASVEGRTREMIEIAIRRLTKLLPENAQ